MPNLIIIYGPPAVGKATIGRELSKLNNYKLLHTEMEAEYVLNFFEIGSKDYYSLSAKIKLITLQQLYLSNTKGVIFTYVHNFNYSNWKYIQSLFSKFKTNGKIFIIELYADINIRLNRNVQPDRLQNKKTKRNVVRSKEMLLKMEKTMIMNSSDNTNNLFLNENYLKIDTTNKSIQSTINIICNYFNDFK